MTLEQFQKSDVHREGLTQLLNSNEILRTALAICDAAAPSNAGNRMADSVMQHPHMAHVQLGVDRGYTMYPQVLRLLTQLPPKQEQVEPTYEAPPEEKE